MNNAIEIWADYLQLNVQSVTPLSGGSINEVYKVVTGEYTCVLKVNFSSKFPNMFLKEAEGLNELRKSEFIIPEVLGVEHLDDFQYLSLEYIESGVCDPSFWTSFATKLANMHQIEKPYFGWEADNYMGELHQSNKQHDSWAAFYWNERILPQLKLDVSQKYFNKKDIEKIKSKLIPWLQNQEPISSSLVHGDLWSGNFMTSENGQPVLIDPAVHYGNREIDIAMTQLFGGFPKEFYSEYQSTFPMEEGWEKRIQIYQLYPLLIHLNLFGSSYLHSVKSIISQL